MPGGETWSRAGWRAHLPAIPDQQAHVARLGEATIPALAAESADRAPDRVAIAIDGEPVTHAELDAGAARVAAWLAQRLEPGDRVLLAAQPSPGFLCCYLGALRAGAVVVLASPSYPAAELAHLVSDSGAAIAFADPGPAGLLADCPTPPVTVSLAEPQAFAASTSRHVRVRPADTALLAYTSGTTGRSKGVPLTHRQLVTSIRAAMTAWQWRPDDVLAHSLPLFHQHGLGGVHATLIAGGTAHVRTRFRPGDLIELVRATRASILFAVPTVYQALLNEMTGASPPLAGLRLAVCGSAPLSPALAAQLPAVLGQMPLIRYGATETGLNVSHPLGDLRGDTVGVPLPGVLARLWSGDREVAPGIDGEIQLRGPQVFAGYWRNPAATAAAFTGDGWFRSGDIGRVDPVTGHLIIRGRSKEMIISGGLNVYPREVEIVLESHETVAEAVVAGIPSERWGEQVTAWVVMRPGRQFGQDELIAHTRAALAAYKCPKQVFQLAALPRNHVGKVIRSALTSAALPKA